ncbi:hypothetical protein ACFSBZ_14550 [Amnibacterium flavum]|uniref:Uncharacterized protein n=1 Tax=Amnibacterium flavum TaxID=2173173 RepID=A0A2V1HTR5_9MICO|nr:hypothetical protein [Amnibacterium flavum]PVZ95958.1 hypothetical protein DDQ50_05750 [Amnibacterium flavum]
MTRATAPRPPAGESDSDADDLVPGAEFNVREFARTAVGSHRPGLDLEVYATDPLDDRTLDLVAYLARLEHSTMRHLRSVLVTPTHKDARVTAFLVTWAYEKYWIADALEAVLDAHPSYEAAAAGRLGPLARFWHSLAERVEPIHESVIANAIGEDVVAVHSATGAVDEWVTRAAFVSLAEQADHESFRALLEQLAEVKARHELFWSLQSRDRLKRSPTASDLARRRLARAQLPLGAIDESPDATRRFYAALISDDTIATIDGRIDELPGLAGLRLLERSARETPRRGGLEGIASWIGRVAADLTTRRRA